MTVDVLYLAFNRLEFTKVSFGLLIANTDWSLVDRLVVYDDGSTDGTREWLDEVTSIGFPCEGCEQFASVPNEIVYRKTNFGSPVEIMVDYLATSNADVFAKCDNDIALPPGWLPIARDVLERHEDLDLLGLAAGWTGSPPIDDPGATQFYGYQPSSHIGGVGLIRTSAFRRCPDLWGAGRQGFTQWQHAHPEIGRGWLTPDLPVVQLDLIPDEPWRSLADYYCSKKWSRPWPPYAEASREWWAWIEKPQVPA